MDAGAWIALLTFMFTVLCAVISVTWIAAKVLGKVWTAISRVWEAIKNLRRRVRRMEEASGIHGERDSDVFPLEDTA